MEVRALIEQERTHGSVGREMDGPGRKPINRPALPGEYLALDKKLTPKRAALKDMLIGAARQFAPPPPVASLPVGKPLSA